MKVEENQYRVGPSGMVRVLQPQGKVRDTEIFHAPHETGVIFAVEVILAKKDKGFVKADITATWQYHTVSSVEEKWPKVLPSNWLDTLIKS